MSTNPAIPVRPEWVLAAIVTLFGGTTGYVFFNLFGDRKVLSRHSFAVNVSNAQYAVVLSLTAAAVAALVLVASCVFPENLGSVHLFQAVMSGMAFIAISKLAQKVLCKLFPTGTNASQS